MKRLAATHSPSQILSEQDLDRTLPQGSKNFNSSTDARDPQVRRFMMQWLNLNKT